jgi:hypothetical protein
MASAAITPVFYKHPEMSPVSNYLDKHKDQLARIKNIWGFALLHNQERKEELCYIKVEPDFEYESYTFNLYNLKGMTLGQAKYLLYRTHEDGYKNMAESFPSFLKEGYGDEENKVSKVELEDLRRSTWCDYKYVGYTLIKAATQYFRQECEGRIDLSAVHNSHRFYHHLGFKAKHAESQAKIEKAIAEKSESTEKLGPIVMFLPKAHREAWLEEIQKNPILLAKK